MVTFKDKRKFRSKRLKKVIQNFCSKIELFWKLGNLPGKIEIFLGNLHGKIF